MYFKVTCKEVWDSSKVTVVRISVQSVSGAAGRMSLVLKCLKVVATRPARRRRVSVMAPSEVS